MALALALAGLLGACRSDTPASISSHLFPTNTLQEFLYCGGEGCAFGHRLRLEADWAAVRAAFVPPADTGEGERRQIAAAIAALETAAGRQAGTAEDRGGTTWFSDTPGQLDCYSEAANTTNFLGLIEREGLMRRHRTLSPAMRGLLEYGHGGLLTHATAAIEEVATGRRYAVDSWYFDNGVPPAVVPLDEWLDGWAPDGKTGA